MIRTYSELIKLKTFKERFLYLKLRGNVGQATFGFDRYLNQMLYTSPRWRSVRDEVIVRDDGCDLGIEDRETSPIIVHHMNPITIDDVKQNKDYIFDLEFLISTSKRTHDAIHYGDETILIELPKKRRPGDTNLW